MSFRSHALRDARAAVSTAVIEPLWVDVGSRRLAAKGGLAVMRQHHSVVMLGVLHGNSASEGVTIVRAAVLIALRGP